MSTLAALPITGHANCNEDVAKFLREMADGIEAGFYGQIRQLLAIVEADGRLDTWMAGGPCDNARMVGLLHMAALEQAYKD